LDLRSKLLDLRSKLLDLRSKLLEFLLAGPDKNQEKAGAARPLRAGALILYRGA
jgi:hypothetical protein